MTAKRQKLPLELPHARDLLPRVYPNGKLGGLRIDGALPAPVGTQVELVVKVKEPAERTFRVHGQLAWARHKAQGGLRECFGVDFVSSDESGRDRLLDFASERVAVDSTRFEERVETDLPVKITHEGVLRKESLFDLSEGGAFVRSRLPPPVGSKVQFQLRPPLSLRSISLEGRVAWIRRTGENRGYGIEFVAATASEAERIKKLLHKLHAAHNAA